MNINQHYNCNQSFGALNMSKATKNIMLCRGELDEFNKFLPDLERKAKKANITIYAIQSCNANLPATTYGLTIRPQNTLKDNIVTRALGLSNNKGQGDAFISVNSRRANESMFRDLYASAFKNRLANSLGECGIKDVQTL